MRPAAPRRTDEMRAACARGGRTAYAVVVLHEVDPLKPVLARFVNLAGEPAWAKRLAHLRRELEASPFRAKLAVDYNWLELILADQIENADAAADQLHRDSAPHALPEVLAARHFAQTVVLVHDQLTPRGQRRLEGRLRDGLQSKTGFSSIYLEIDVARRLLDAGYSVEFSDMDCTARYDLRFWRGTAEGEVECKSLSADAGRKIHRHDFYRFMDAIGAQLADRLSVPVREAIVVTLQDRLPSNETRQEELRSATRRVLLQADLQTVQGSFFSIVREECKAQLESESPPRSERELYERYRRAYGDNCHVSGALLEDRSCMIVMRSQDEDDHSAPQLEALRKAASQFSGTRPAFIAVQYDDLTVADLALPHVRRRAGLLSFGIFRKDDASHVIATCFSAYGGLVVGPVGAGIPAFEVDPIHRTTDRGREARDKTVVVVVLVGWWGEGGAGGETDNSVDRLWKWRPVLWA